MTATNIHIRITERAEPVRKRVTIPESDVGTQNWWNAQRDPSTAVRLLILDEVRKYGYVDRVNRTGARLHIVGTGSVSTPAAAPASTSPAGPAPSPAPPVSPVSAVPPVAPAAAPPVIDPRDSEIQLLRDQVQRLSNALSPFLVYDVDLANVA